MVTGDAPIALEMKITSGGKKKTVFLDDVRDKTNKFGEVVNFETYVCETYYPGKLSRKR